MRVNSRIRGPSCQMATGFAATDFFFVVRPWILTGRWRWKIDGVALVFIVDLQARLLAESEALF